MTKQAPPRESFTNYYNTFLGGRLFRWLDFMKVKIIRRILNGLTPPSRILDLGCGAGSISGQLINHLNGTHIVGVDHDHVLLATARKRGLTVVAGSMDQTLPFGDDSFDLLLMIDTIEHVTSRNQVILEAKRVLKKTGTLLVFTPPYDSIPWLLGEWVFKQVTRRQPDHISPFTGESLTWLLRQHFQECKTGRTNFNLTLYGMGQGKIET